MPQKKWLGPKERFTVSMSKALIERLRDAAFWESKKVSHLVQHAVHDLIFVMEKTREGAYPRRPRELKAGAPRRRRHNT